MCTAISTLPDKLYGIELALSTKIENYSFSLPVQYVYNPIKYASAVHFQFLHRFCQTPKKVMFLGMNPGPWGMSQTGIPFGDVHIVREWMGISGEVGKPGKENPHRPVRGFTCRRSEVSGQRFWGLIKELCEDPASFFENCIVYNHCPVAFMSESGRNITPNELKIEERKELTATCDEALWQVVNLFGVSVIVAIGKYAEKRAVSLFKNQDHINIVYVPHPSPRNCGNAEKWKNSALEILENCSLLHYFKRSAVMHCTDVIGNENEDTQSGVHESYVNEVETG